MLHARVNDRHFLCCFVLLIASAVGAFPVHTQTNGASPDRLTLSIAHGDTVVSPGKETELKAVVYDRDNNVIPDAQLEWLVRKGKDFVYTPENNKGDRFFIFGRPLASDHPEVPDFIEVQVSAKGSGVATGLILPYRAEAPSRAATIKFGDSALRLSPLDQLSITADVLDSKGATVTDEKLEWTVDEASAKLVRVGPSRFDASDKKYHVEIFGLKPGAGEKFPTQITLTARAGGRPLGFVPITGTAALIDARYNVLPYKIARHVFGKAIANDYYCIGLSAVNVSGGELQVSSIYFDGPNNPGVIAAPFGVVRASENRNKLLNTRTLLPLIASALSTVMNGFTPFYINKGHQDQYRKFLNLIAIPSRDAVNTVFPDTIGLESTNLDTLALQGEKIVPNTTAPLTSILFIPKKSLPGSDEPPDVKRRLGDIRINGFQITRPAAPVLLTTP